MEDVFIRLSSVREVPFPTVAFQTTVPRKGNSIVRKNVSTSLELFLLARSPDGHC